MAFAWSAELGLPTACSRCSGNISADSVVARHCEVNDTIRIEGRCCVEEASGEGGNSSRVVIGYVTCICMQGSVAPPIFQ